MDNIIWNKCQTPLDELSVVVDEKTIMFQDCPSEVQEQFWDYLNNVPFIRWMVSLNRPLISELPRDEFGKAIIDVTKPPILEGSDYFRQSAINWQASSNHQYVSLKPNANPNSEFGKYIREERRRGWEGFVNPDTGMWVTGDYYWMLNYCPMHLVVKRDDGLEMRTISHPRIWDGQFLSSHYILQARQKKHHAAYLASRGKGKTTLGGAMLSKRFIIGEFSNNKQDVQCLVTAADKTKLIGVNQILSVFIDNIDFCAKNTQFASRRLKSSVQELTWQMGYKKSGSDVAYGSKNSVQGIISGVNQDKLNGSRGVLYIIEEAGIFKDLNDLYGLIRPSVEQGSSVFGEIILYGCVCVGTKVWTNDGRYLNIEDLHKEDGIIGYENDLPVQNTIGTLLEPRKKPCVKITWEDGGYLECSTDHPILKQVIHTPRINGGEQRKRTPEEIWVRANELKKGDRIIEARYIGAFGNDTLGDPRLVGMLIGDGSYGYDNTPKFSSEDEELLTYVKNRYDWGISAEHKTKEGRHYQDIRVKGICPLLRAVGIYGQTKTAKRLPVKYQTLTEEDTRLLLAGLYDTDGCITRKGNDTSIQLVQANRAILEQVAILLRKFGILSTIAVNKPSIKEGRKDKNPWYILRIGGRVNIQLFYENIPLIQKRKVAKLDEWHKWSIDNPVWKTRCYDEKKILPRTIRSVEYIGVHTIYNLSAEQSHTYLANNIVTHNTAGNEQSDFTAFAEMFYSPEGYNLYGIENVFDKEGQGRKQSTFFYPVYMNYDDSCIDKDGNSNITKALLMILMDRYKVKYGSTDVNAITKRISQYPITPQEAIIRSRGNMFPVTELNARLNEIDNNPNEYDDVYVGELVQKDGKIEFVPTGDVPIREFPTKDNKVQGAVEIYCMPQKNPDGTIPRGRYIAGADPYDNDVAESMSLGSFFILDTWTDTIVMEYTGRPMYADDFYEICRKACLFYNATLLYEQNKKGLFPYFSQKNSLHLLADTPEYLLDKQLIKGIGYGNAHPYWQKVYTPTGIKQWGDIKVGDLLFAPDGTTTKVIDIPFDEETEIYKLTLKDGRVVYSSSGHLWNVIDYNGLSKVLSVKQMLEKGFSRERGNGYKECKYYIPQNSGVSYKEQNLPLDPYFLGLMLGDGCFTHSKFHKACFTSIVEDLEFYKKQVQYSCKTVDDRHHWWDVPGIGKILDSLDLLDKKSHTKFVPNIYKYNTKENRLSLLQGLLDTDGYITAVSKNKSEDKGGIPVYTTVSEKLAEDVVEIARSLGISCTKKEASNVYGPFYNVYFFTELKLFRLPRKMNRQRLTKKRAFKTGIVNIEKTDIAQAKCVTVDREDGLYLIGEYVTTHNCRKGVTTTLPIKNFGFSLIRDWLLKPTVRIIKNENGENEEITVSNLYNIRNRALLKELILYNPQINVDRIMALCMLMIYREEKMVLFQGDLKKRETQDTGMAADDYWSKNYPGKHSSW